MCSGKLPSSFDNWARFRFLYQFQESYNLIKLIYITSYTTPIYSNNRIWNLIFIFSRSSILTDQNLRTYSYLLLTTYLLFSPHIGRRFRLFRLFSDCFTLSDQSLQTYVSGCYEICTYQIPIQCYSISFHISKFHAMISDVHVIHI